MEGTSELIRNLDEWMQGRENNFDFLRFLFALLVLYSHCFYLSGWSGPKIDLGAVTQNQIYLGALGVDGFFAISGFLITMSWLRSKGLFDFLKKRVLRIFPGFIIACLVCAFVVAPLGAGSAREYFSHFPYLRFALDTLTLKKLESLPPTFQANLMPEVNGSLWTIRIEFECYLMLPILAALGFLRRRAVVLAITIFVLMLNALLCLNALDGLPLPAAVLRAGAHVRFVSFFLAGMTAYLYRDKCVISRPLIWGSVAALLLTGAFGGLNAALPVAGTYLLLVVALNPSFKMHRFGERADMSYGVYLYAWPIQQLIVRWLGSDVNPYLLFALATPLSCVAALVSWFLVEKPFLQLKARSQTLPLPAAVAESV